MTSYRLGWENADHEIGTTQVVRGTSAKGNAMTDTYSLSGVTAAIAEIEKACA